MLAGFLPGSGHDGRLVLKAQVNLAIRWFAGYGLHEALPDYPSLTRTRQRWGAERFRRIFERTVTACVDVGIVSGEVVHVDTSLIRADVSRESLAVRHVEAVEAESGGAGLEAQARHRNGRRTGKCKASVVLSPRGARRVEGRDWRSFGGSRHARFGDD